MLNEPDFIGDWYREKKLGSGGFGYVLLWKNKKTNQSVAIKKCHIALENAISQKQRERWDREVELMTEKIQNDNIVKAVHVHPENFIQELYKYNPSGMKILIMEYCNGGDLRRSLNQTINYSGLIESDIRLILKSLRNAINYLHNLKITHRDIKPENIVIQILDDGQKIYKLTDLGYAKPLDRQSIEASLVGTMEYLAPELLFTDKYSCTVDYWSMGIIAYEIITGVRPFIPHMSLARWILHVKTKTSDHISIVEDNKGNIEFLTGLCKENYLSISLRTYLEQWIKLAVEWNPKQRGCVFMVNKQIINDPSVNDNNKLMQNETDDKTLKSVSFANATHDDTNAEANKKINHLPPKIPICNGPITILKIFTMLDEILNRKIITFFCLHTYSYLSYELNDSDAATKPASISTMNDIYEWIEKICKIKRSRIYLILSIDNQNCDKIDAQTNPSDLYIPQYYDKPMVFISEIGTVMNGKQIEPPILSNCIQRVLSEPKEQLKQHTLREFSANSLFLVRNEQQKYMYCLNGFKNYALQLNHEIIAVRDSIIKMIKSVYGLNGQIELYNKLIENSKEKLIQMSPNVISQFYPQWQEQCVKYSRNIEAMIGVSDTIMKRYESIVRRSKEIVNFKLLENIHKDFYDTQHFMNAVDALRIQIANKNVKENAHRELFSRVYSCLKQRDKFLFDKDFLDLQRTMNGIHIEFEEILKANEKALIQIEKYQTEFYIINGDHQKNVWNILQLIATKNVNDNLQIASSQLLPNIDIFNNNNNNNNTGRGNIHFDIGKSVTTELQSKYGSSVLCFGEGDDARSLIDDNAKLRVSMEGLMRDINEDFDIKSLTN